MSEVQSRDTIGGCVTRASQRGVVEVLRERGVVGHDELCDAVGVEWDKLTVIIRALRSNGVVVNRLDRRYELAE